MDGETAVDRFEDAGCLWWLYGISGKGYKKIITLHNEGIEAYKKRIKKINKTNNLLRYELLP